VGPLNLRDFERLASESLEPGAYAYITGGAGDEQTLADNVAAFRSWLLRPRVLVDVSQPSTATTVLGTEIAMPVLAAPIAFQRVAHPDGEVATARAVAAAGTILCLSTLATATQEEIAATGVPRWFQLYVPRDPGLLDALLDGAAGHGFSAIVLTVDTPVLGRRERSLRTSFEIPFPLGIAELQLALLDPVNAFEAMSDSVTWGDVERFASRSGLPVLVKGVLSGEDARLACEHGAAGVVVSNHGGRQLDGATATIDALPEVVDAVDGRIEVLLDGGVRRGIDVIRALALGARAVLVGRPIMWGLAVDGERGVAAMLELLRAEIELGLQLIGCRTPTELTRAHVWRGP
jgi:isopentenyl diphosphate isomerase/L-lactate dehydrogenase-like FMN-dependent dehydrogenase